MIETDGERTIANSRLVVTVIPAGDPVYKPHQQGVNGALCTGYLDRTLGIIKHAGSRCPIHEADDEA